METEESTEVKTEDESETYNYPASDLLRNDVRFYNIKPFFFFFFFFKI